MKNNITKVLSVLFLTIMCLTVLVGCGKEKESEKDEAYKEPLETFFSGVKEKDIEKVLKAFPDFMKMDSMLTLDDIDTWYKNYEKEYGENITIEYSFGEAIRYEGKELDEFKAELTAAYDNISKDDIKDAYFVPVIITIKGDKNENSDSGKDQVNYYAFKYKESWYIR